MRHYCSVSSICGRNRSFWLAIQPLRRRTHIIAFEPRTNRREFSDLAPRFSFSTIRGSIDRRSGSLKVVTTNMKPGYLRRNGVPYSANTFLTEDFDRLTEPNAG